MQQKSMRLHVFSAQPYDRRFLSAAASSARFAHLNISLIYHDFALSAETVSVIGSTRAQDGTKPSSSKQDNEQKAEVRRTDNDEGAKEEQEIVAVCVFVNDALPAPVLDSLSQTYSVRAILLRCAGYNNVDIEHIQQQQQHLNLFVGRVPAYSPAAVAEFAVALIQTLNRHTHKAYNRVREGNLRLQGLLGRTLEGKTVGIVGTGKIGRATARILGPGGFGCRVLGYDVFRTADFTDPNGPIRGQYTDDLDTLLRQSDIVSLHCPLLPATHHLINSRTLSLLKPTATLINTSRGQLIDTKAVIAALKARKLAALGLDVYEQEGPLFFADHSYDDGGIQDEVFLRLMTFPNVLVTGHQAFFTEEALTEIAEVTMENAEYVIEGREADCPNKVTAEAK